MDKITVGFLRWSLVYLLIGSLMGLLMTIWPQWTGVYFRVHGHINLLGFVLMLIFGVGYHILPRFSGQPLFSPTLARIQLWLMNIAIIALAVFWSFEGHRKDGSFQPYVVISALILLVAIVFFVINMFKTIKGIDEIKK